VAIRKLNSRNVKNRSRGNVYASLILAAAIVFATLVLNRRDTEVEAAVPSQIIVAQYDTVMLPVPAEPIAAGVRLKDVRFKNVSFPKQQIPEGAVESLDGVINSVSLVAIPADLPLFRSNLTTLGHVTNPVVEKIPPGMRAMTIRVDATSAVEGWAGSGSIVDVLLVEKDRTTVVAEMVKILSAERSVSPVDGTVAPNVPSTVTLLVTQEQCLAINTAIPLGRIAFALRSSQDLEKWLSTKYTPDSLRGGAASGDKRIAINGFVSMSGQESQRNFVLSDGKWIATDVVPDGFFAKRENLEKAKQNEKE
jgi:Flp pilus assembly protein CpaB